MDPTSASAVGFKAWEAAGLTGLLIVGLVLVIYGVWKSMDAREKRQAAALEAASQACEVREKALAERLTEVESRLIAALETTAARALEVSVRSTMAIENQTRVTERVLARLDQS